MGKTVRLVAATLAILGGSIGACSAAISVTFGPGEPGTGNCLPFGCQPVMRYQQVYSASLFPARLSIEEITFFNQLFLPGTIDPAHYTVLLSVTDKAVGALDLTNLDNNVGSDQELFFNQNLPASLAAPSFTIDGDPYVYDPADGNLLLEILKIGGSGVHGTVFLDRFTNDPTIGSSRTFEFDGVIGDPAESYVGLVTRFTGVPLSEPSTLALLCLAAGGLTWLRGMRDQRPTPASLS